MAKRTEHLAINGVLTSIEFEDNSLSCNRTTSLFHRQGCGLSDYFEHKGYGRIFVEKAQDIPEVWNLLKAFDENEVEGYAPENLISVFNGEVDLVYNMKFTSIDINAVIFEAWKVGIRCFWLSANANWGQFY